MEYRFQPDGFEVRHVRAPGQVNVDLDELLKEARVQSQYKDAANDNDERSNQEVA